MTSADNRAPWADFWALQPKQGGGGCLPQGLRQIDAAQRAAWERFARQLGKGARLLDLATGDGAVLKKLQAVRRDLKLTGVDSSKVLPKSPDGITLRAGIAMEKLPFADGSFDAVTSQFGYEYGATAAVAREVARVLKRGGRVQFLVHRRDGPIVAHNLPRRDALLWALAPGGHFEKARRFIQARSFAPIATPAAFAQAPIDAGQRFPGQSAGTEFLQAVLETLMRGRGAPVQESLEVMDELERKARNEIGRIDSLDRAARDPIQIEEMAEELRLTGLTIEPPGAIAESNLHRPFGWILAGQRPS